MKSKFLVVALIVSQLISVTNAFAQSAPDPKGSVVEKSKLQKKSEIYRFLGDYGITVGTGVGVLTAFGNLIAVINGRDFSGGTHIPAIVYGASGALIVSGVVANKAADRLDAKTANTNTTKKLPAEIIATADAKQAKAGDTVTK